MKFLLDLGIKENTINSIYTKYDEGVIDNLLIFDLSIFTKDIDYIKECFNKHDIKEIVKLINEDITNITKI